MAPSPDGFSVDEQTSAATKSAVRHTRTYTVAGCSIPALEAMLRDARERVQSFGIDPAKVDLAPTYDGVTLTAVLSFLSDT